MVGDGKLTGLHGAVLVLEHRLLARQTRPYVLGRLPDDLELQGAIRILRQTFYPRRHSVRDACGRYGDRRLRLVRVRTVWQDVDVVPQLLRHDGLHVVLDYHRLDMLSLRDALHDLVVERTVVVSMYGGNRVRNALLPLRELLDAGRVPHVVGYDLLGTRRGRPDGIPVSVGRCDEILDESIRSVRPGRPGYGGLGVSLPRRDRRTIGLPEVDAVRDDARIRSGGKESVHGRLDVSPRNALDEPANASRDLGRRPVGVLPGPAGQDLQAPLVAQRRDPVAAFGI